MEDDSYVNTVGLGYGIAIAVGILVLVSSIMLASYVCVRVYGRRVRTRTRREAYIQGNPSSEASHRAITMGSRGGRDSVDAELELELELELEEAAGGNTPTFGGHVRGDCTIGGLDEATLDSYPKFKYMSRKKKLFNGIHDCDDDDDDDDNDGDEDLDSSCSICLADYCDGELLRMLPDCRHRFHTLCVDEWLRSHASCPICRTISPLPTPGSTPLSLLIPIARSPLESLYR